MTRALLNHFEIDTPCVSNHQHNEENRAAPIVARMLEEDLDVALVTDAGTPAISDPGEDLVRLCIENEIEVEALPGPCAFATALVASGMPTGRFAFEGFLTVNRKNRLSHLESVKNDIRTLIFYEAPHKLLTTLKDMLNIFGDREITLARELTKHYEEYRRTTLKEAINYYEEIHPKGEFVLIIKGADEKKLIEEYRESLPPAEDLLRRYAAENLRAKELTRRVADELKLPRREIYELYLKIKDTL